MLLASQPIPKKLPLQRVNLYLSLIITRADTSRELRYNIGRQYRHGTRPNADNILIRIQLSEFEDRHETLISKVGYRLADELRAVVGNDTS
jgi:hypothetical protein